MSSARAWVPSASAAVPAVSSASSAMVNALKASTPSRVPLRALRACMVASTRMKIVPCMSTWARLRRVPGLPVVSEPSSAKSMLQWCPIAASARTRASHAVVVFRWGMVSSRLGRMGGDGGVAGALEGAGGRSVARGGGVEGPCAGGRAHHALGESVRLGRTRAAGSAGPGPPPGAQRSGAARCGDAEPEGRHEERSVCDLHPMRGARRSGVGAVRGGGAIGRRRAGDADLVGAAQCVEHLGAADAEALGRGGDVGLFAHGAQDAREALRRPGAGGGCPAMRPRTRAASRARSPCLGVSARRRRISASGRTARWSFTNGASVSGSTRRVRQPGVARRGVFGRAVWARACACARVRRSEGRHGGGTRASPECPSAR